MIKDQVLDPNTLINIGRALLCLSFGISLLIHIRRGQANVPFERLAIGFLCLMFFVPALNTLDQLSILLSDWIKKLADPEGLKSILFQAYQRAARLSETEGGKALVPEIVLQIWRTGVWAVTKSLCELLFLVVAVMLENGRAILWKVLAFLAPISIGFLPLAPRLVLNTMLFFLELSLWIPTLRLIQIASFPLAKAAHESSGTVGVSIVAIQLLCALLYLSIPAFTHRFVAGALTGDIDQSHKPISATIHKIGRAAGGMIS